MQVSPSCEANGPACPLDLPRRPRDVVGDGPMPEVMKGGAPGMFKSMGQFWKFGVIILG